MILERTVRFVGEPVAVVAAETEEAACRGTELLEVTYRVYQPNLDFETAIDNGHPIYEKGQVFIHFDNGNRFERNIIAAKDRVHGDVDAVLPECAAELDETFYTQAQAHAISCRESACADIHLL